jgi:hypothetical protein
MPQRKAVGHFTESAGHSRLFALWDHARYANAISIKVEAGALH